MDNNVKTYPFILRGLLDNAIMQGLLICFLMNDFMTYISLIDNIGTKEQE